MRAFGPFELDPAGRRVWRDGQPLPLRERAVEVLLALLERPGQVVGKRALAERAWPELDDAENNLQVEISALRRQFGPGLIVTVPGRGYQLALPAGDQPGLVGREGDLAALREALAVGGLVTLTGEGGVGKSALAAAWAAATPGVLRVALDGVEDRPAAVHEALAAALQAAGPLWLDDADGAVAALAAVLEPLLQHRADRPVLVTTRETLGMPAERVLRLGGLPPDAGCALLHRWLGPARAVEIGEAHLAALCSRVEGHPLALEWLAERLCCTDPAEAGVPIGPTRSARFQDSTRRPARHHRLFGALEESAAHLTPERRRMWQALATLPDPFTFDDLPASLGSEWQRAEDLAALVERSLVQRLVLAPQHRLSALVRLYLADGDTG